MLDVVRKIERQGIHPDTIKDPIFTLELALLLFLKGITYSTQVDQVLTIRYSLKVFNQSPDCQ